MNGHGECRVPTRKARAMRIQKRTGDAFVAGKKNAAGEVSMMPDGVEDLWHAYQLVNVGDQVLCTTFRKITKESSTGSVDSQRVKLRIQVAVIAIDFDPEGGELRLNGTVLSDHDGVRLGSHHTLELEVGRAFTLMKACWDVVALERLEEAHGAAAAAELVAVLVQHGLATVCVISNGMSVIRAKIEAHIPRKGSAIQLTAAGKASDKWNEQLLQAVVRHIDFDAVKCVVLAGPGFVKDQVLTFLFDEAARRELRPLQLSRSKWVTCHASSAYKHALKEVLADPVVIARVADTAAAAEVRVLATFFEQLSSQPDRVTYGYRHVHAALEQGAIAQLLLADDLFRAQHIARRRQYVELVESVRGAGGTVHIFSSFHVSGEQLARFSGVAALLRFPLPLDDILEGDGDGNELAEGQ